MPGRLRAPAVALLTALLTYAVLHRAGAPISKDGWEAWQGAVSLVGGHGYTLFSGAPIVDWPPLYSVYLSIWLRLVDPGALSLVIADGVLIGAQGWLWTRAVLEIAGRPEGQHAEASAWLVALFIGLFVGLNETDVLSHNLAYAVLPIYVMSLWRLDVSLEVSGNASQLVLPILSGVLLLMAHNACIAIVAAGAAVVVMKWPLPARRLFAGLALFIIPAAAWTGVRLLLGQTHSHPVGWGAAKETPATYVLQLVESVGRFFVPDRAGAPFIVAGLLVVVVLALVRTRTMRFAATFVGLAMLATFALFNLTWIAQPLGGRYIYLVPLFLVPVAFLSALPLRPRLARAAMGLALLPTLYWIGLHATGRGEVPVSYMTLFDDATKGDPNRPPQVTVVPMRAFIDRAYRAGPPRQIGDRILLAPPSFGVP